MCCFNLHGFARCILENQKNELTAWRLKEKELQKPEVTPWFLAPMTERGAAASREGQVLRENCLEGPLVSFFFLVQGVIILLSLLKDSFSGYAVVGWLAIPCPASTCGVTALCLPSLLLGSRLYQACFVESAVSLPPPCAAFSDFSLCLWFFVVSGFRAVSRGGFLGIGPYGNRWWWFFLVGQ